MLSKIRDRASGWIAWAIVIVISIPFALWGVNSYFEGATKVIVAKADGIEIEQSSYQQALSQEQRNLVQLSGQDFDPEFFSSDQFKLQVLNRLINQALQNTYIESRRYKISDGELNNQIQAIPSFMIDGRFNQERYRTLINSAGFSIMAFEEQQRREAMFKQIENSIVATAIAPKFYTDRLINLLLQDRQANYTVLDLSSYYDRIVINDDDAENEFEENRDQYFFPAQLKVNFIKLSIDKLLEDVVLEEQEIRKEYENNLDRFIQPESRFVRHILLSLDTNAEEESITIARDEAESIIFRVQNGEDFSELAEELSDDLGSARRGGDLGVLQPGAMPPSFELAANSLQEGEISEAVRTDYGFHIIQAYKVLPEALKSYDDVRSELANDLKMVEAESRFVEMAEDLRNISYEQSDSLEPVADALNLELEQSDWFTEDAGKQIFSNSSLRRAAFSDLVLVDELNSDVVEVDLNTLVVMRKLEYRQKRPQAFLEVKSGIIKKMSKEKALSDMELDGLSLVEQLQSKEISWSEFLSDKDLKEENWSSKNQSKDILLNESIQKLVYSAPPPDKKGEFIYGKGWSNEGHLIIYELTDITDGDITAISSEDRDKIRALVLQRDGVEMLLDFENKLRLEADLEIFEENL